MIRLCRSLRIAVTRAKNPPKIQSRPAFVIKEPDLFPEGMAYARYSRRIYAGSIQRKIVWTDNTGEVHDLVKPGDDGLGYVAGLHVDEARRQLWAVSSKFGNTPDIAGMVPGLFQYDLTTGKRVATFVAPNKSAGGLNDVAVAPSTGLAYTTNTGEGSVYCTKAGSPELELFLPRDSVPGANGIALSDDEKTLFVAGDFGVQRVDLATKTVATLHRWFVFLSRISSRNSKRNSSWESGAILSRLRTDQDQSIRDSRNVQPGI